MASVKSDKTVVIRVARNFKGINIPSAKIKKIAKTVCDRFPETEEKDTSNETRRYEISIAIVDNVRFRELNRRYLNRNSISDCLSFDLSDDNEPNSLKLYEIIVNGELAAKQAGLRGHSGEAELALYITHGLLHNLGFDDSSAHRARKMHEMEDEILQQLGYGIVYNKNLNAQEHKA
ncbi:MAG: rRNA maturation RNase YbeY [Sedimentisphaerales bacterium]|nr:rRNA maturation RNase YbeY [Sedimentisphaerales bacterium]